MIFQKLNSPNNSNNQISNKMIRKLKNGDYRIYSIKLNPITNKRRNLSTFKTLNEAKNHERQIEYFKELNQ